jgi:hypothetical protein
MNVYKNFKKNPSYVSSVFISSIGMLTFGYVSADKLSIIYHAPSDVLKDGKNNVDRNKNQDNQFEGDTEQLEGLLDQSKA